MTATATGAQVIRPAHPEVPRAERDVAPVLTHDEEHAVRREELLGTGRALLATGLSRRR